MPKVSRLLATPATVALRLVTSNFAVPVTKLKMLRFVRVPETPSFAPVSLIVRSIGVGRTVPGFTGVAKAVVQFSAVAPPEAWLIEIAPLVTDAVMSLPRPSVMAMLLALTASQRRVSAPGAARAAIPRLPFSIFRPKSEEPTARWRSLSAKVSRLAPVSVVPTFTSTSWRETAKLALPLITPKRSSSDSVPLTFRLWPLSVIVMSTGVGRFAPGLTGVAMACCQLSAVAPPEAWLISSPAFVTLAVMPGRTSSTERFEAVTATHERVPVGAANVATPSVPPLMAKPKLAAPACRFDSAKVISLALTSCSAPRFTLTSDWVAANSAEPWIKPKRSRLWRLP